ncbi:MAG: hypothetical protein ABIV28_01790 [Longimicrobiales bacterium]
MMARTRNIFAVAVAIALGAFAVDGHAQTVPFGKNKIQYRSFDWQILSGKHLDVYFYPEEEAVARLALSYGEESYDTLERKFQHHPFRRIPLIVYAADQDFEQTNLFPGFIPEGVLGFTEYLKRRVALPFRGDYEQFRSTLRHELVHAFQLSKLAEVASQHPRLSGVTPQQIHWWTEGLGEYWSSEQTPEDDMYVRDLVLNGNVPTIQEFSRSYTFFSYPLGAELHKYLSKRFGEEYIAQMYEEYFRYESFESALRGILGVDLDRLSTEFKYSLEQRYFPAYGTRPPLAVGSRPIITKGGANYKPIVFAPLDSTPAQLLFMSPRDGYTSLYVTPLDVGEPKVESLLKGERSAEFESFHAFESGFDVSDGGVLVLGSKFQERDALLLWDIRKKEIVGRYQWPDLVGIRSPAWDPTGHTIVFEGLSTSGISDLYAIDFDSQQLKRLTNDRYRDADPDWSPDGKSIVFSSDRTLSGQAGDMNLFLLDVATESVRYLTSGHWKDQAPRWSRTGDRIAFSSNRSGDYDLYIIDTTGAGSRVTELTGGAFDPEWLPGDEGIVFAGYSDRSFKIYRYDFAGRPAGARIALNIPDGVTGPAQQPTTWPWQGSDSVATAEARAYRTLNKMTLDFAAADAVVAPGIGSSQGAQFLGSDLLGNHIVFVGVSATQFNKLRNFVDNFTFSALYLNLSHRLNYGGGIFRVKGLYRDVSFDVYEEESFGAYFLGSYPLSKFRRIELQLGVSKSNRVDVEDGITAGLLQSTTILEDRDLTRRGIVSNSYISYVKDNTLWLPTGPIDGERYNISLGMVTCFVCSGPSAITGRTVDRSAAAENWVALADYRRYFRLSLHSAYAVRAFGYYSGGAIPGRSVLGGPHRLRGYPYYSLAGSRVGLLNQEVRFPLLTGLAFGFPFGTLRLPGIEGAVFADAGTSWLDTKQADGLWGSYGGAVRMSLGAPLVLRMDVGRRFAKGTRPPVIFTNGEKFRQTFIDFFVGFDY